MRIKGQVAGHEINLETTHNTTTIFGNLITLLFSIGRCCCNVKNKSAKLRDMPLLGEVMEREREREREKRVDEKISTLAMRLGENGPK